MLNPYRITEPTCISFSGGRTSAYMLYKVLEAHNGKLPEDAIVCFANTGKEEEAVIREVKTRYSEKELGKSMAIRDVTNRAWEEMNTTGSLSPKIEAALNQVAPEELRQIRDWKQADLARKQRDVNKEATDNPETYYGLRLLSQQNPAAFADPKLTNLLAYKPHLSNEQFNSLVTLQSSISKGDALHSQSEKMVQAVLQNTKEDIRSAGIDLNAKPGSTKATEAAKFVALKAEFDPLKDFVIGKNVKFDAAKQEFVKDEKEVKGSELTNSIADRLKNRG